MPGNLFNSPIQRLLVTTHRLVSSRLNLHDGLLGTAYRRTYFFYKRLADRHLIASARRLAKPGTLIVDIGANIGFFTLTIAKQADVTILAFEPDRQNFQGLEAAIAAGGLGHRIRPYMLALSDATGVGTLYLSDLAPTDHKLIKSRSSKAVEITVARLDDFFAQQADLGGTPISLIKIDVQGGELLVLRGMPRTLQANNYPPILTEYSPLDLAHAGATPRQFFDAFAALGYRPHSVPDLTPREPDWIIRSTHGAYTDLAMIYAASP